MIDIMKCIDDMLNYKESLGFSRHTFEHELNDFGRYFTAAGHTEFTADTVRAWCMRRDTESPSGYRRRLMPLREFSKYLYAMGYADYVIPTADLPIVRRNTPYILSDSELLSLFAEADKTPYCKRSPCRHLIVPVIFRVIYFCGLRPNESRELRRDDFNFRDRTMLIRKNKAHRERLICF